MVKLVPPLLEKYRLVPSHPRILVVVDGSAPIQMAVPYVHPLKAVQVAPSSVLFTGPALVGPIYRTLGSLVNTTCELAPPLTPPMLLWKFTICQLWPKFLEW